MTSPLSRARHFSAVSHRSPPQYHCRSPSATLRRHQSGASDHGRSSPLGQGALAAVAVAAGTSFGYYLASLTTDSTKKLPTTTFDGKHAEYQLRANGQVFDLTIPSQSNPKSTHAVLSLAETEAMLKANANSISVKQRPGNPILRWDTNIIGANPVCEDRIAIDLVGKSDIDELIRTASPFWPTWRDVRTRALSIVAPWQNASPEVMPGSGSKDIALFSVFDGHQGTATVEHISKVLHPTLVRALGRATLREQNVSSLTNVIQDT